MNYLWVDSGVAPDYAKGLRQQIDGYFFDMFNVTKAELQEVKARGLAVGVYMASNWPQFQGATGPQIANIVNQQVRSLQWGTGNGTPKVQFDMEEHTEVGYERIASCLEEWRRLQPKRDTSWTMEGHQGGSMSKSFVTRVLGCRVRVVPQCYDAPMAHAWCPLEMARDLVRAGFPDSLISPFHDAARLPQWWQGFAFTQNRLPS